MKSPMSFARFARVWPAGWTLAALFALTLLNPLSNVFAAESTCSVAPSGTAYATIQAAVNDGSCTTINVAAGTYYENIVIGRNVTINGAKDGSTIVDGNHTGAVFDNTRHVTVTLTNLTIQHGSGYNNGEGQLLGGGIINIGYTTVANSTIRDNSADQGGGIFSNGGVLTLVNSTVTGNSAINGGGIITGATVRVFNSTISDNDAPFGGNINNYGTMTLVNTILAHSGNNCQTSLTPDSHNNLIDSVDNACGLTNGTNGNIIGQDAKLGAIQDNGGSTATIALLPDSPAINAGDDAVCSSASVGGVDQRGVARPAGTHCDIGAYEATATDAPVVTVSFPTPTGQNGWFTSSPVVGSVTAQSLSRITGVNCSGAALSNLSLPAPFFAQGVLTAAGDGTYTVSCNSSDADGRQGAGAGSQADATVKIDTTAPTVSGSVSQTSPAASATVTLNANDATSGIASTSYTINGGASQSYNAPFALTAAGSYHISFTTVDNAGNSAAAQNLTVTIASPTITHSPSVEVIDAPPSVVENVLESSQLIRMFPERQNYTLPQEITVNGTVIPAGTKVNVFYIHADKVGNDNSKALKLSGSVVFDTKVLAVISNGTTLKNTHSALGSTTTTYSSSPDQGIEYDDKVTVSAGKHLNMTFNLWSMSDDLRVITLAP